jgi:hypothetical protein
MALTKQAKVVKKTELGRLLHHVERGRHPERDRVMVLLSKLPADNPVTYCLTRGERWRSFVN